MLNISAASRHVYNPTGDGVGLGDPLPKNGAPVLMAGSWAAQVVDELEPKPEDISLMDLRMSGFWDTPLDHVLAEPRQNYTFLRRSKRRSVRHGYPARC